MKRILFFLIVLALHSCEKEESLSVLSGNWQLVSTDVLRYSSNGYTGEWSKLNMNFDGDTLTYKSERGINFSEVTSSTDSRFLYNLNLTIKDDVVVSSQMTNIETSVYNDTTFNINYEEGEFDFIQTGGKKYDFEFEFGKNDFYILGLSNINSSNLLYAIREDITSDSLVLRIDLQEYQPTTLRVEYKYIFQKIDE